MAYSKNSWTDGTTPVDAERLNHLEDGVGEVADTLDSLSSRVGNFYYKYSDSSSSSILSAFQDNWDSFSSGYTFWNFSVGTRGTALVWKQSTNNGAAIVFGMTAAFNPPRLIRYSGGTWYDYSFTVTQN